MLVGAEFTELNSQEPALCWEEMFLTKQIDTLIVYVHGAFASPRSWYYIQKQVNKSVKSKAKTGEHYFEYDLQEEDAFLITSRLTDEVRDVVKKRKPNKVLFVGHSFGGVLSVASSRQLEPEFRDKVEMGIITMSSPFSGARIASIVTMFTPSSTFFQNISHNSQFMWNFKNRPLVCETHSFVTNKGRVKWIAGENDGVVTLDSQLHFKNDPLNTVDVVDLNHFEILLSDNIAARIIRDAVPKMVSVP